MNVLPEKVVFPERTLMGAGKAQNLLAVSLEGAVG